MKQYDMKAIRIVHPDASIISYSPKNQAYTYTTRMKKKLILMKIKLR